MSIAIFPQVSITKEGNRYSLKSYIHVHAESEFTIKVHLYPIKNSCIAKTEKERKEAMEFHLKECLRISKYGIFNSENVANLPFVTTLFKNSEDFTSNLHYLYP